MPSVVRNVFDFDNYQPELKKQIADIMMKHGIPVGDERKKISLAERWVVAVVVYTGILYCEAWDKRPPYPLQCLGTNLV